jgi:uncharacterized membrane protein
VPEAVQIAVSIVAGLVTAAGVVAILVSIGRVSRFYWLGLRGYQPYPSFKDTRLAVGQGLVLALEFFVGADLLRTVLQPSLNDLIVVSVVVVLRTIISLSLDYELKH